MIGRLLAAVLLVCSGIATPAPAHAQGRGDRAGDFDFYVLALSWSPSFCASRGERGEGMQCGRGQRHGFVVHGLWPQWERGFPSDCTSGGSPTRAVVDGVLDVMPSPGLVRHQWRKHGSCSGLGPAAYFNLVRRAREAVAIPDAYRAPDAELTAAPAEIERAFMAANPGLRPDMIAVDCGRDALREVRVCMRKDLAFRPCPEVDRRACRARSVAVPPVGGN